MTATAEKIAAGLRAVLPEVEPDGSVLEQDPELVEAQRRRWGVCVGAVAEALQSAGELHYLDRVAFYRACGVEIAD